MTDEIESGYESRARNEERQRRSSAARRRTGKRLTAAQRELKRKHGTPDELADACRKCLEITDQEEVAAIWKYRREWEEAGKQSRAGSPTREMEALMQP